MSLDLGFDLACDWYLFAAKAVFREVDDLATDGRAAQAGKHTLHRHVNADPSIVQIHGHSCSPPIVVPKDDDKEQICPHGIPGQLLAQNQGPKTSQ